MHEKQGQPTTLATVVVPTKDVIPFNRLLVQHGYADIKYWGNKVLDQFASTKSDEERVDNKIDVKPSAVIVSTTDDHEESDDDRSGDITDVNPSSEVVSTTDDHDASDDDRSGDISDVNPSSEVVSTTDDHDERVPKRTLRTSSAVVELLNPNSPDLTSTRNTVVNSTRTLRPRPKRVQNLSTIKAASGAKKGHGSGTTEEVDRTRPHRVKANSSGGSVSVNRRRSSSLPPQAGPFDPLCLQEFFRLNHLNTCSFYEQTRSIDVMDLDKCGCAHWHCTKIHPELFDIYTDFLRRK